MLQQKQRRKGSSRSANTNHGARNGLSVRGLTLIGIGGIIGAGFFLGCGLPIRTAGPAVLVAFLFGGLITAQVIGALTSMAINHPTQGSFQVYAEMYLGRFAGYLQGWTYYLTSVLTISSEAVAMAVFVKLWLPHLQTVLLAAGFAAIIVAINAFGLKSFERIESIMSVLKIGALIGFIVYGIVLFAVFRGHAGSINLGATPMTRAAGGSFVPHGWAGVLQSMLIVIFAYAGIGVFASATAEVKHGRDIDKAALWTIALLTGLYLASIALVLWFVPWQRINTSASPFVAAITANGSVVFAAIFNGVIMVAAFSVMAGALYSANRILVALGHSHDAPRFVTFQSRQGTAWTALLLSAILIAVALGVSAILPANVYGFLVSASSYFTFLNWFLILLSFIRWQARRDTLHQFTSILSFGKPVSTWLTAIVLVGLAAYGLFQRDQRMGFYAALAIAGILSIIYWFAVRGRQTSAQAKR